MIDSSDSVRAVVDSRLREMVTHLWGEQNLEGLPDLEFQSFAEVFSAHCRQLLVERRAIHQMLTEKQPQARFVHTPQLPQVHGFEVKEKIGQGNFGAVYRARNVQLQREVALKIPFEGRLTEREKREARLWAGLKHPNIASLYSAGANYLESELVRGETLAERLSPTGLQPLAAATICVAVCQALSHAHAAGIIHRDLKPSNIMINEFGSPVVVDFGLAHLTDNSESLSNRIVGTQAYMSPEQAQGRSNEVDSRSDVFSLGVVLFEMCTGKLPYTCSGESLRVQVAGPDEIQSARSLNPLIPQDLATICSKCLEKSPARRFQSAEAVRRELERFLHGIPILSRRVGRFERIARYVKRHPRLSTLYSAIMVFSILCLYLAVSERAARMTSEKLRSEVAANRATFMRGVTSLVQIVRPDLKNLPEAARKDFLKTARTILPQVYLVATNDVEAYTDVCRARFEEAIISLDDTQDAADALHLLSSLIAQLTEGVKRFPSSRELDGLLVSAYYAKCRAHDALGQQQELATAADRLLTLSVELLEAPSSSSNERVLDVAKIFMQTASILRFKGLSRQALKYEYESCRLLPLTYVLSAKEQRVYDIAWIARQNVIMGLRQVAPEKAVDALGELRAIQSASPAAQDHSNVTYQIDAASVEMLHADIYRRIGRSEDAMLMLGEAERIILKLLQRDAESSLLQRTLADVYSKSATVAESLGDQELRIDFLKKDYQLSSNQLQMNDLRSVSDFVSITAPRLADAYDDTGDSEQSLKLYGDSLKMIEDAGPNSSRKLLVALQSMLASWSRASAAVRKSPDYDRANDLLASMATAQVSASPRNLRHHEALAIARYNQIKAHEGPASSLFEIRCSEFRAVVLEIRRRYENDEFEEATSKPLSFILQRLAEVDLLVRSLPKPDLSATH